jgi:nickel-dependent lactate racemase
MKIELPYGKLKLCVDVPKQNLLKIIKPRLIIPKDKPEDLVKKALNQPLKKKRLEESLKPNMRVTIVVDDKTRPCPSKLMLPPLLKIIHSKGISKGNVTILFGCGTHEPVNEEWAKELLGTDIANEYKWYSSSNKIQNLKWVYKGTTSGGTKVLLNSLFAGADFRIILGDIEPHYFAGYGGGRKSVLPGVTNDETIQANHKLMFDDRAKMCSLKGNPVHLDMMEAADLAEINLCLNVVQNRDGNVVGAFAGDHREVLKKGVELVDKMSVSEVRELADIAITAANGHPHDINLYQAHKAVSGIIGCVKKNGALILVAQCKEGAGSKRFWDDMGIYYSSEEVKHDLLKNFFIGRHKTYYLLKAKEKMRMFLVSEFDEATTHRFAFEKSENPQKALDTAFEMLGRDAKVLVSPWGSTTLAKKV